MKTILLKSYLDNTHSLLLLLAFLMMMPLAMWGQTTSLVQVTNPFTLEVGETYVITSNSEYAIGNQIVSNNHYLNAVAFDQSNTTNTAQAMATYSVTSATTHT